MRYLKWLLTDTQYNAVKPFLDDTRERNVEIRHEYDTMTGTAHDRMLALADKWMLKFETIRVIVCGYKK